MSTSTVSVSAPAKSAPSNPQQKKGIPLRFVTAASLFDGHDASINIMRRILQGGGVEVIHMGHNRSVAEVVSAAIQVLVIALITRTAVVGACTARA